MRSRSILSVCVLSFLFLYLPHAPAHAAILINEVAWMGGANSANDEWIELYNDGGSSVDVTGWELSDGVSLSIVLEGSIAGGVYWLLERSDDDSVPGKAADFIYTGALSNDGRTLSLYRADGSLEDRVVGGENWESLGGNNETKDTAQLTQSGWITASPTPKAKNNTNPSVPPEDDHDDDTESSSQKTVAIKNSGNNAKISMKPSGRVLTLDLGEGRVAYVNQEVDFNAEPHGMSEKLVDSLRYSWNFGDGHTKKGKEVSHAYTFPGTYVVVAHAEHASFEDEARIVVTVLPTALELALGSEGQLFVHNNGSEEIDLSGFTINDWQKEFMLPDRTIILPRSTLTLSPKVLNEQFFSWAVDLKDVNQNSVARLAYKSSHEEEAEDVAQIHTSRSVKVAAENSYVEKTEKETINQGEESTEPKVVFESSRNDASVIETFPNVSTDRLAIAGLIGLIAIGLLVLYTRRIS